MDPAAQELSADGAIAFAQYAMEVYSYLYLTGDAQTWTTLYTDCSFCADATVQAVDLWGTGGSFTVPTPPFIAVDNLTVTEPVNMPSEWTVTMEVTENDSEWSRSDGSVNTHLGEVHSGWTLTMTYDDGWTLVAADPGGAA